MEFHTCSLDIRPPATSLLEELKLRFTRSRGRVDTAASLIELLQSAFLPKRGRWHTIVFRGIGETALGQFALGFRAEEKDDRIILTLAPELPGSDLMICLEQLN